MHARTISGGGGREGPLYQRLAKSNGGQNKSGLLQQPYPYYRTYVLLCIFCAAKVQFTSSICIKKFNYAAKCILNFTELVFVLYILPLIMRKTA